MQPNWEEEFFNLMQAYRTAPVTDQAAVITAFNEVKDFITELVEASVCDGDELATAMLVAERLGLPSQEPL